MKKINYRIMRKAMAGLLMLLTLSLNAQVKFMGIPVDGSKSKMINKLKQKGFDYDSDVDLFQGEFDGKEVMLKLETYKNTVYRVSVMFGSYFGTPLFVIQPRGFGKNTIKNMFNDLVYQFNNNDKYLFAGYIIGEPMDPRIDADEDIEYQMQHNNKTYRASYRQLGDTHNNAVYFTIVELYGDYFIVLNYENLDNRPDGSDY